MTYDEAIQFWRGRINYEQKPSKPGDLKLDRMRLILERLGNPHRRMRIVHIAGTKGKGSTAAMLANILQHEGYRVGLFTSPHLVEIEERIQVDQHPISREELTERIAEIAAVSRKVRDEGVFLSESLTFFEVATALGFLHFAYRRVDWAVVEVGLGGRFDSTNVCIPEVAIITSISFDHTEVLGSTLTAIAREKAGIIKPGRPIVSGVVDPQAQEVIANIARERKAPLRQLGRDFRFTHHPAIIDAMLEVPGQVKVTSWRRPGRTVNLRLIGEHQAANAAVTLAVVETLRDQGVPLHPRAIQAGLANVSWPARMELLGRRPFILIDCAHNVASAEALLHGLLISFPSVKRRALVFGGSRDKDLSGMLAVLGPHFETIFLTHFDNSPRSLTSEQLLERTPEELKSRCILTGNSRQALDLAKAWAHPEDLICAAGSVFLAGEIRPLLLSEIP